MSADSSTIFGHDTECSSFFEDLFDFQQQDYTTIHNAFIGSRSDSFPSLWNDSPFSCFDPICSPDLAPELSLSVPYEDVVHMESLSGGNSMILPHNEHFPSTKNVAYDAVSVLESSSSSSSSSKVMPLCADHTALAGGRGKARSKRPRPPAFNPGLARSFSNSPPASATDGNASSHIAAGQKKKMKVNQRDEMSNNKKSGDRLASQSPAGVRKCLHCEITKTPQWRAGPMGPKTLCNACGVRHKSGRLFPEYRPSASPTFVQSLHSSSHKKVLEMRSTNASISTTTTPRDQLTVSDAQPELIPNISALLELEYM